MIFIMFILYMWWVFYRMELDYWQDIDYMSEKEAENITIVYWFGALILFNLLMLQVHV